MPLEIVLRASPELLGRTLQNLALSKYDRLPGGIYASGEGLPYRVMLADFETEAFFNGYRWRHRTDERGFRNPPGTGPTRILLLGDSMIYGHGVEAEETVAHHLRADYGHAVYDLSRQGDCLFNHYVLLRLYLAELDPSTAILFVHPNDFRDVEDYRRREVDTVPELARWNYRAVRDRVERALVARPSRIGRLIFRLRVVRLMAKTPIEIRQRWRRGARRLRLGPSQKTVPAFAAAVLDRQRFERVERYYDKLLADLSRRCRRRGVRLVLVQLDFGGQVGSIHRRVTETLASALAVLAKRHGIELYDTGDAMAACGDCRLQHDGHFSPKGHRVLSEFLHREILASVGSVSNGGEIGNRPSMR